MSLQIDSNRVVSMHYKLTDDAGNLLDESQTDQPLAYLHGAGNIIPGLEQALAGKSEGDNVQVTVPPAHAYGEVRQEMIQVLPRSAFQGVEQVEPGMAFEAQSSDGQRHQITVKDVADDEVTVDGNHPLAGVELHFEVDIVDVREATAEELDHGHVHS